MYDPERDIDYLRETNITFPTLPHIIRNAMSASSYPIFDVLPHLGPEKSHPHSE